MINIYISYTINSNIDFNCGWVSFVYKNTELIDIFYGYENNINNRGMIQSFLKNLDYIKYNNLTEINFYIYDNAYVSDVINKWLIKWKKENQLYKKKNSDLWERVINTNIEYDITYLKKENNKEIYRKLKYVSNLAYDKKFQIIKNIKQTSPIYYSKSIFSGNDQIKPIKEHSGYYITNDGRIWNNNYERWLGLYKNTRGYYHIDIGGYHTIHRFVAQYFVDNSNNKPHVNHIDGVKANNQYTNLEWVTNLENQQHAHAIGLFDYTYKKQDIYQYDVWGNFIQFFHYIKDIKNIFGQITVNSVNDLKTKNIKISRGYIWIKEQYLSKEELKKYFPIRQYSRFTGELINSFISRHVASNYVGFRTSASISIAIKNHTLCGGYFWKNKSYLERYNNRLDVLKTFKSQLKPNERYKQINGFPDYYITDFGRVWSNKLYIWITWNHDTSSKNYYIRLYNYDTKIKKKISIRFLVYVNFHSDAEGLGKQVTIIHKDGNISNNHYTNLEKKSLTKKVCQYDKQGNFIKFYNSIREAKRINNIGSSIFDNLNGKTKSAGGYIWKYAEK